MTKNQAYYTSGTRSGTSVFCYTSVWSGLTMFSMIVAGLMAALVVGSVDSQVSLALWTLATVAIWFVEVIVILILGLIWRSFDVLS